MASIKDQVPSFPIHEIRPGFPDLDRLIMDVLKTAQLPMAIELRGHAADGRTIDVRLDLSKISREEWVKWAQERGVELF